MGLQTANSEAITPPSVCVCVCGCVCGCVCVVVCVCVCVCVCGDYVVMSLVAVPRVRFIDVDHITESERWNAGVKEPLLKDNTHTHTHTHTTLTTYTPHRH